MQQLKTSWSTVHNLIFLVLLMGMASCSSPESTLEDLYIGEPFKLVQVSTQQDTSTLSLNTILPTQLIVDSVSGPFDMKLKDGNLVVHLNASKRNKEQAFLQTIQFHIQGIPYSTPVYLGMDSWPYSEKNCIHLIASDAHMLRFDLSMSSIQTVYCYWNNLKLETNFAEGILEVKIPPFAKYIDRGFITVFALDKQAKLHQRLFPLRKGKVITELVKLRQDQVKFTIHQSTLSLAPDPAYLGALTQFKQNMIEQPLALSLLYGAYSLVNKQDSALLYQCSYGEERSVLLLNAGMDSVFMNFEHTSLAAPGKGAAYGLISQQ